MGFKHGVIDKSWMWVWRQNCVCVAGGVVAPDAEQTHLTQFQGNHALLSSAHHVGAGLLCVCFLINARLPDLLSLSFRRHLPSLLILPCLPDLHPAVPSASTDLLPAVPSASTWTPPFRRQPHLLIPPFRRHLIYLCGAFRHSFSSLLWGPKTPHEQHGGMLWFFFCVFFYVVHIVHKCIQFYCIWLQHRLHLRLQKCMWTQTLHPPLHWQSGEQIMSEF